MNVRQVLPSTRKSNNPIYVACGVLLVSIVALTSGCVGVEQETWDPTDKENILLAISHVQGEAGKAETFPQVFADGSAPPESEREKYVPNMFKTSVDEIDINSDTATVQVRVEDTMTSELIGEVEWTLVKVGDDWKITDAPLP